MSRRTIATRRRAVVLVGALLVLLPVVVNVWAVNRSRHAMVAAVEKAELASARSAAVDAAANLKAALSYTDAAAHRPGLAARVKNRDRLGLLGALDSVGAVDLFRGFVVFDSQGVIAATGSSGLPGDPAVWQPGLHAVAGGIFATVPILDDRGHQVGGLAAQFDIEKLLPQLLNTRYGRSGSASLVTEEGLVVASGVMSRRGQVLQAPVLRPFLAGHREGVAQHWEPVVRSRQITAVAPIPGQAWSVLVAADEAEAYGPAAALSRRLAIGFSLVFVLSAGLLVALVRMVTANRQALERINENSRRMALTDPLTGIGNRRALEDHLAAALADRRLGPGSRAGGVDEVGGGRRGPGGSAGLTVTLIDLDGFKELNDRHGHQAGDRGLRDLAAALASAVRDTDLVARLGGDEFAVVQHGVDAHAARAVVDRLRARLGQPSDNSTQPLTFSAGIAVAGRGDDVHTLLERADRALYRDKRTRKAEKAMAPVGGGHVIVLTP